MKKNKRNLRWDRVIVVVACLIAVVRITNEIVAKDIDKENGNNMANTTASITTGINENNVTPILTENTIDGANTINGVFSTESNGTISVENVGYINYTTDVAEQIAVETTVASQTTLSSETAFYSTRLGRYVSDYEMYLLTMICCSESGFEGYDGKVAVVATVLNRIESNIFPNNVYDVIFQKSQFSSATNGVFHNSTTELKYEDISSDMLQDAENAVKAALNGEDPTAYVTGGSLYFYNPDYCSDKENAMRDGISCTMRIGNHIFYREWD